MDEHIFRENEYYLESSQRMNEAMKNAIGIELTQEIADELYNKYPNILKPLKQFDIMQNRISWLINYVDKIDKKDLIGLKISNIANISYSLDNKLNLDSITLTVGNTEPDSCKLLPKEKLNDGLYHMKYGINNHWQQSKEALFLMPNSLTEGVVTPAKERFKYEIYFRKRNCIYIVGVPSPMGDATILISCLKRDSVRKPQKHKLI